jgi:hypothetical protein
MDLKFSEKQPPQTPQQEWAMYESLAEEFFIHFYGSLIYDPNHPHNERVK